MQLKGWKLRKSKTFRVVNCIRQFHTDDLMFECFWLTTKDYGHHSSIQSDAMCHWVVAKKDHSDLAMILYLLIDIGMLVQMVYYSTQNGLLSPKLCFPSASWRSNHYCSDKYISKIANIFGFESHKTTISTETDHLYAIHNQFTFMFTVIGIFVFFMKYWLGLIF